MNNYRYILASERVSDPDFELIPLIVRMKLDLAGCKISLSQWQLLPPDIRAHLIDTELVGPQDIRRFRQYLDGALRAAGCQPSKDLPREKRGELMTWLDPDRLPDSMMAQLDEQELNTNWRSLNTFGRYVVWSLLHKGRTDKLKTVLAESCLYQDRQTPSPAQRHPRTASRTTAPP